MVYVCVCVDMNPKQEYVTNITDDQHGSVLPPLHWICLLGSWACVVIWKCQITKFKIMVYYLLCHYHGWMLSSDWRWRWLIFNNSSSVMLTYSDMCMYPFASGSNILKALSMVSSGSVPTFREISFRNSPCFWCT